MFSTVRFSVTLAPTAPQFAPFSLSTSFWGSMNTTAGSLFRKSMSPLPCLGGPSGRNFIHLSGELFRREDCLPEQDIGEGDNPPLVICQFADHLGAQRLDTAALLLGVDDLVKIQDVGQRVAALLPRLQHVVDRLDRLGWADLHIVRP